MGGGVFFLLVGVTPFGLFFILVDRPFFVLCKGFITFPGLFLDFDLSHQGSPGGRLKSSVLLEGQLDSHY